jgi:hypothetical protein
LKTVDRLCGHYTFTLIFLNQINLADLKTIHLKISEIRDLLQMLSNNFACKVLNSAFKNVSIFYQVACIYFIFLTNGESFLRFIFDLCLAQVILVEEQS